MYHNIMEMLVENKVNDMWKNHTGCTCERCREDVVAYTLNSLPPRYVVTNSGELYARAKMLEADCEFEIMKQAAIGMTVIAQNPRH